MPCVARERKTALHAVLVYGSLVLGGSGYETRYMVSDICTLLCMSTLDIVHERCAKFNTRRMARMGILYYTTLY